MRIDKGHIQKILTETVLALCQTGIPFDAELSIEGLLGITLDKDNIILVNIKEVIRHDVPTDYSTKSEKRKADVTSEGVHKRQKDGHHHNAQRGGGAANHSFIPDAFQDEDSGNGSPNGNQNGNNSLKIPLIPPEYVHAASQMVHMRNKHVTDIRQKHSELSRILAVANLQRSDSPKSINSETMRFSPDVSQTNEPGNMMSRPQSAMNLASDFVSPRRSVHSVTDVFNRPIDSAALLAANNYVRNMEGIPGNGGMIPTDLSLHTPTSRPFPSNPAMFPSNEMSPFIPTSFPQRTPPTSQQQQIGVVLDTNVEPPAPLAVVAGTGVLQAVTSMPSQPPTRVEHDFFKDLPEGTAIVQPVEIVPEEDIRHHTPLGRVTPGGSAGGVKKERSHSASSSNSASKKEKMGRPKKSKEFCRFRCTICNAASSRKFNLQRHVNSHHPNAANCIVDLTPPKNPRQMRMKGPGGQEMTFHNYDAAMYGTPTPEGVSIDNAMDLSVSPSPEPMGHALDDDDVMSDATEDLMPPQQHMQIMAGTGFSTPLNDVTNDVTNDDQSAPAVVNTQRNMVIETPVNPDAKKRFAKSKKSLDNMLFNKFGNYHSFAATEQKQNAVEEKNDKVSTENAVVNHDVATDDTENEDDGSSLVIDTAQSSTATSEVGDNEEKLGDNEEKSGDNEEKSGDKEEKSGDKEEKSSSDVQLVLASSEEKQDGVIEQGPAEVGDDVEEKEEMEVDASESSKTDDVITEPEIISEKSKKRESGASDSSVETDANANNKSNIALEQISPDVNGNSRNKNAIRPKTDETLCKSQPTSELNETPQDSSSISAGKDELSNGETLEKDNNNEEQVNGSQFNNELENNESFNTVEASEKSALEDEEDVELSTDLIKENAKSVKDSPRITRRSQSSTVNELDEDSSNAIKLINSPLSPRKNAPFVKGAVIREPIKTRTSTRASSITTRRSSVRDENESK